MEIHPWTQRLSVRWRSDLRFYEERFAVLRQLEGLGLLRAFQIEEDQISARLGDEEDELILGSAGLTLRALVPESDLEQLTNATRTVFEAIRPKRVRPQIGLQHLIAVEADYDLYRRRTVETLFPTSPLEGLALTDWALMLTGETQQSTAVNTEFGIVSRRELPVRLARSVGRIAMVDDDVDPSYWDAATLPEVAFFCDSVWTRRGELDSDALMEELSAFWQDTLTRSAELATALHEKMTSGSEIAAGIAGAEDKEERGGR